MNDRTPDINGLLQNLGLTGNESLIYIELLKEGNKTAAELARILSLDKSSSYRACERLEKMGLLISSPKRRGSTYIAQDPEAIYDLYHNKLKEMERIGSDIDANIVLLKKMAKSKARNTQIRMEYGPEALRKAMTESLESKDKLIRERIIGDLHRYLKDETHTKFVINFAKTRAKKGIKIIQLEKDDSFVKDEYKDIMVNQKKYLKEVRFSPKEWNDTNSLRIWDDVINIITYDDNNEFLVITIRDKFVAELMKNFYDFIWNRSEPLK